jgi:probable F420-dependent oxidoreductase
LRVYRQETEVQVGLVLPTREAVVTGQPEVAPLIALAELAEAAGYDSVWVGDSLLARPRAEPLSLLAAVAARTQSVRLGTAVLLAALRQPVLFAHTVATLDRLAAGRLILGLGAGFPHPATEAEFAAAGVPFHERIGRLEELVRICRLLWSGEDPDDPTGGRVSYRGRYLELHDLRLLPKPHQRGGPPLWLAGAGEKALRRVGHLFDGWLPYSPTPAEFAAGWQQVQLAAEDAGRSTDAVTPALYVTLALDSDSRRARAGLESYVQAYYGQSLEAMARLQAFYYGDVEGCLPWLGEYVAAGARHIIMRFGTLTGARAPAELAATRLLPQLKRHAAVPL